MKPEREAGYPLERGFLTFPVWQMPLCHVASRQTLIPS